MAIVDRSGIVVPVSRSRYSFLPDNGTKALYSSSTTDHIGPISFTWGTRYACFFRAKIFSTPGNASRIIESVIGQLILLSVTGIKVQHVSSSCTSGNVLVLNEWHNYAVTFHGTFCRFYRDGIMIEAESLSVAPNTSSQSYYILNNSALNRQFDGYINQLQWFNREFHPDDIKAHYISSPNDTSSLALYYKLDEGSGTTATDSSGNGLSSTITGCSWVTYSDTTLQQTYGKEPVILQRSPIRNITARNFTSSLYFDGTTGIVRLGTSNFFSGNLTFGCWMYWNGENGGYQTIFSKRDSYDLSNLQFSLNIRSNDGNVTNDTIASYVSFANRIPTKRWLFFSWVRNTADSTESIYADGALLSSKTMGTFGNGTGAEISIGATQNPSIDWFNGYMKEIYISATALTPSELFNLSNGTVPAGTPFCYLKAEEGTGTTLNDTGAGNHDGTIDGATWSTFVPTGGLRSAASGRIAI